MSLTFSVLATISFFTIRANSSLVRVCDASPSSLIFGGSKFCFSNSNSAGNIFFVERLPVAPKMIRFVEIMVRVCPKT